MQVMNTKELSRTDVEGLIVKFDSCQLPKEEWTHQAHIVVAFWYNWHYPFTEALNLVRKGIVSYNEAVGTPNTDDSGYHETLTVFWMRLTRNFLQGDKYTKLEDVCNAFLLSKEAENTSPFNYYSRDFLFSVQARKEWVDGDLQKVPIV